jgi:hypothetical protein
MEKLPDLLWINIFNFLIDDDIKFILNLELVNKYFRNIST